MTLGSRVYSDGGMRFNCAGPVADSEAKLHCGRAPDYRFSFGCGIFRQPTNTKTSWIHRVIHSSLQGLDANAQYEASLLSHDSTMNRTRFNPVLDMNEIPLDDISIDHQVQQATRSALTSQAWTSKIAEGAWQMVASLFCFAFIREPVYEAKSRTFSCVGTVFFRYPEHYQAFVDQYGVSTWLETVDTLTGDMIPVSVKHQVMFSIESRHQPFDIRLRCHSKDASISGFPDSAEQIWNNQYICDGVTSNFVALSKSHVTKKRKSTIVSISPDYHASKRVRSLPLKSQHGHSGKSLVAKSRRGKNVVTKNSVQKPDHSVIDDKIVGQKLIYHRK